MDTFRVLTLFAHQIDRALPAKCVVTPSSINEKGVVVKISLLKTYVQTLPRAMLNTRVVRVRVSVCGTAESHTGLKEAVRIIEALDAYLYSHLEGEAHKSRQLEDADGKPVPNTRIVSFISEEDSFIDTPDTTEVQDVQDDRTVIIYHQWEETE